MAFAAVVPARTIAAACMAWQQVVLVPPGGAPHRSICGDLDWFTCDCYSHWRELARDGTGAPEPAAAREL